MRGFPHPQVLPGLAVESNTTTVAGEGPEKPGSDFGVLRYVRGLEVPSARRRSRILGCLMETMTLVSTPMKKPGVRARGEQRGCLPATGTVWSRAAALPRHGARDRHTAVRPTPAAEHDDCFSPRLAATPAFAGPLPPHRTRMPALRGAGSEKLRVKAKRELREQPPPVRLTGLRRHQQATNTERVIPRYNPASRPSRKCRRHGQSPKPPGWCNSR